MHMVSVLMQIHYACYFIVPFFCVMDVGLLREQTDWLSV